MGIRIKESASQPFEDVPLVLSSEVKSLRVSMDISLSIETPITPTARSVFLSSEVGQAENYLDSQDLATVIRAMVTSRLDQLLLWGVPRSLTLKLQLVQNAAWVLMSTSMQIYIQLVLC